MLSLSVTQYVLPLFVHKVGYNLWLKHVWFVVSSPWLLESCCVLCSSVLPHISECFSCAGRMPESVMSQIIAATCSSCGISSSFPRPTPLTVSLHRCASTLLFTSTFMSDHFFFISAIVGNSEPAAFTASVTLCSCLLPIPEERPPNIFFSRLNFSNKYFSLTFCEIHLFVPFFCSIYDRYLNNCRKAWACLNPFT